MDGVKSASVVVKFSDPPHAKELSSSVELPRGDIEQVTFQIDDKKFVVTPAGDGHLSVAVSMGNKVEDGEVKEKHETRHCW